MEKNNKEDREASKALDAWVKEVLSQMDMLNPPEIEKKNYPNLLALLDDTDENTDIYIGAKSGWIFIAKCKNVKPYLEKINKACRKSYYAKAKKDDKGNVIDYVNLEDRKIVDYYPRLTDDGGICVVLEGTDSGRNWDKVEQVNNCRADIEKEEKKKKQAETAKKKQSQHKTPIEESEEEKKRKQARKDEYKKKKLWDLINDPNFISTTGGNV